MKRTGVAIDFCYFENTSVGNRICTHGPHPVIDCTSVIAKLEYSLLHQHQHEIKTCAFDWKLDQSHGPAQSYLMATFNSFASIVPEPSVSKRSNASLEHANIIVIYIPALTCRACALLCEFVKHVPSVRSMKIQNLLLEFQSDRGQKYFHLKHSTTEWLLALINQARTRQGYSWY